MAVACSSKGGLPLGFSLHLRAEEAIAKFQREIEDDFNYLHEILAEAKQHFGRRDSNILLPKTPSMKRKRHESDDEQSSDDAGPKTTKEAKAHKTQGYASPLMVINENETLDCSVANEEGKQDGAVRRTRANRGNSQPKRQQPKRGSRRKNAPDVGSSAEDQSSGSSMDEKPRRNTRNSRKKNLELSSLVEEKETELTLMNEKELPKRSTRNARKKYLTETVEVSSAEELPAQPATKKRKSSTATRSKNSGEITAEVVVKQETASPPEEMSTRRSARNSRQEKELVDNDENENRVQVPETPEAVVEKVVSPPMSAKTCKATVNLVLQSPGFNIPKANRATSVTTSPCIEQDHGPHEVTVEENNACPYKETKRDVVTVCSPTPVQPQESAKACAEMLSETNEGLENREVEIEAKSKKDVDSIDGNVDGSNEDVEKENAEDSADRVKSGRRSTQRNSGWRRKSKRSSFCLSPTNKPVSVNMTVTKTKKPGKKSLVKSSVKLKLTQSKLMPELNLGTAEKSSDSQSANPVDSNLEDVRVRLFDNLTSESSACSASPASTCTSSSCSSTEDKTDAPVETITEEPTEEDGEEVFHDCRGSENEADDEADNAICTAEINSKHSPTVKISSSPRAAVHTSRGSSGSEESVAPLEGISEEPTTPPPPQEVVNPQQKGKPNNIALVHSFIRRNTPKKVDPEEKKKQLRIALKEKEEKEKERREQLEIQRQKEIEERKRRREERAKKAAEQRAAKLQALEEKKRQAEDQRLMMEEKAKKLKEKEEEDKKKQRNQKRAEIEARRKQEEAARLQRKREQEEEEKRQREMLQKKQELEEQERQRKIAEAKRHQEHREKELEKERELEKQRKLKAIEEKEKRLREKEEKERRSREEKQRIERERKAQEEKEREERERARIAQLIREKEEHARREREQRAREEKERQDKERRLKEEREAALREKKRQEQMEKERRALEERKLAEENKKVESSKNCDSYEMTPPPVRVRKPASNENYNIADLQSDDSTDDEDNPRKKIPSWARPAALKAALFHQEYSNIDVNSIFENVPAPNLEEIFSKCAKKKRFNHRTSSAIWDSPPLRQQVKRGTYV